MTVTIRQLYKLWGKCAQDLGRYDLWDRLGGQALVMISRCYPRVVTKISSCRGNTTSRRGIKRLGISFRSLFLLFSNKSSWGPLS